MINSTRLIYMYIATVKILQNIASCASELIGTVLYMAAASVDIIQCYHISQVGHCPATWYQKRRQIVGLAAMSRTSLLITMQAFGQIKPFNEPP